MSHATMPNCKHPTNSKAMVGEFYKNYRGLCGGSKRSLGNNLQSYVRKIYTEMHMGIRGPFSERGFQAFEAFEGEASKG